MLRHTLLLVSGIAFASAASPGPGSAFGSSKDTAFVDANRNPNITKTVPFQMGDRNFTFRVNVAEFTPDTNTSVQDLRIAASFYALEWSGSTDLNDTIATAESVGEGQKPRLCASIPLGLLSASANNGYDEKDDGDCTGALGKDCVNDLKQSGYDLGVGCSPNIPQSCSGKFGDGGIGSSSLLNWDSRQNSSERAVQMSPFSFYQWSSQIYPAGNGTAFERESERLHVVVFSGKNTYPVCLRVKTDHLNKKSPAASGAAGSVTGSLMPVMIVALSAAFWLA